MKSMMLPTVSVLAAFLILPSYAVGQSAIRPDTTFSYLRPDSLTKGLRYSRILLKHHFLCACLEDNQVTAKAFSYDYSRSGYFERLVGSYSLEGLDKLLAYEKRFLQEAAFSGKKPKSEHNSAGDIFFRCMKQYEGRELDAFSRSLDPYFLFPRR
jgi:hypothetical protein